MRLRSEYVVGGAKHCAPWGHSLTVVSTVIAVAMKSVAAPSIEMTIGVTRPPLRRMPAIPEYALPTSASPPARATESASCVNVCAASAASDCASIGAVLSLRHAASSAPSTTTAARVSEWMRSVMVDPVSMPGMRTPSGSRTASWESFAPLNLREEGPVTTSRYGSSNVTRSCTGKLLLRSVATAT
jgi:hypothetical protein